MTGNSCSVLLVILLLTAVASASCGGDTETSPSGSGGSAQDASVGGQAGSVSHQGGSTQGGASQGGAAGAGGSSLFPSCTERGGECLLMNDLNEPCPAGSYNPFSGSLAHCPTGTIRRCCVPKGKLGSPCTPSEPCDDGGCLTDQSGYPVGGYCSKICEPKASDCPAWAVCLPVVWSQAMGACLIRCSSNDVCREGWSCQALPNNPFSGTGETTYACWEGSNFGKELGAPCGNDSECLSMLCRPDKQQQNRCSATCDNTTPCLSGYGCKPAAGCSTSGCGTCAPN